MKTVSLSISPGDCLVVARRDPEYSHIEKGFYPILEESDIVTFQGNCRVRVVGERHEYDFMRQSGVMDSKYDNMSREQRNRLRDIVAAKLVDEKNDPWTVEAHNPLLILPDYTNSGDLLRSEIVSLYVDFPRRSKLKSDSTNDFLIMDQGLVTALFEYSKIADAVIAEARRRSGEGTKAQIRSRRR